MKIKKWNVDREKNEITVETEKSVFKVVDVLNIVYAQISFKKLFFIRYKRYKLIIGLAVENEEKGRIGATVLFENKIIKPNDYFLIPNFLEVYSDFRRRFVGNKDGFFIGSRTIGKNLPEIKKFEKKLNNTNRLMLEVNENDI